MNEKAKAILQIVEAVVKQAVPVTAGPIAVAHAIVDHKGKDAEDYLDAAQEAIKVVEAIKGTDIADEVQFRAGIATMEAGFRLVQASLKVAAPEPAA